MQIIHNGTVIILCHDFIFTLVNKNSPNTFDNYYQLYIIQVLDKSLTITTWYVAFDDR